MNDEIVFSQCHSSHCPHQPENYKLYFKGFVVKGLFQRPLSFGFISKASFTFPPLPPSIFSSVFTFGKWADCHRIHWHHNHPPITQSNHIIPIHSDQALVPVLWYAEGCIDDPHQHHPTEDDC